jgi:AcrR family transcriptional regulator
MVCMSRPRFHRLPSDQQEAILDAALREFATHGFGGASLNRIIEATGASKGAMYYYFDGKEDLYADVIRRQLERLLAEGGPLTVPDTDDADAFWATVEEYYLRLLHRLAQTPETGALLRDWLTGAASPSLREAQRDAEQATTPWMMRLIEAGQAAGAVRSDVPADFLVAMAFGMGQAADTWLLTRDEDDAERDGTVHTLFEMMRRALSPQPDARREGNP